VGSGSGHETLLQPAEWQIRPMPAGSACTVSPLAASSRSPEIPAPHSSNLANGVVGGGERSTREQAARLGSCLDLSACAAGSRTETAEESGIAHFLEHMVFQGAARHSPPVEHSIGASRPQVAAANAASGFDRIVHST